MNIKYLGIDIAKDVRYWPFAAIHGTANYVR